MARVTSLEAEAVRRRRASGATHAAFDANPADHCETSYVAWADAAPLIDAIVGAGRGECAGETRKSRADPLIWDLYWCAGTSARHLGRLGFSRVHHSEEDFYAVIRDGREARGRSSLRAHPSPPPMIIFRKTPTHTHKRTHPRLHRPVQQPPFDVLATNPPYSGDHPRRLLHYAARCGRPYLLLLPHWCAVRPWWTGAVAELPPDQRAVHVVAPLQPYAYWTPERFRVGRGWKDSLDGGMDGGAEHKATKPAWTPARARAVAKTGDAADAGTQDAEADSPGVWTTPFPSFWAIGGLGGPGSAVTRAVRAAAEDAGLQWATSIDEARYLTQGGALLLDVGWAWDAKRRRFFDPRSRGGGGGRGGGRGRGGREGDRSRHRGGRGG